MTPDSTVHVLLLEGGKLPERKTVGAAGFDLCSRIRMRIRRHTRAIIPCGVILQMPQGMEAQVRGRSGLAIENGIWVHVGTIDADYRGEVGVIMYNTSSVSFSIVPGDRIGQLVFSRLPDVQLSTTLTVSATERGAGGFGSTGVRAAPEGSA